MTLKARAESDASFFLSRFAASPVLGLGVVALFILIQQIENTFVVPKVMQKAVGINPLISIVSILVGGKIGGIVGVLLAIPVATALGVILGDFFGGEEDEGESAVRA